MDFATGTSPTPSAIVPPQISAELTQILANLVLGDNEIRSSAEKAVNERLDHTPELYLLALVQFAITADTEPMRSFSLVLLRRMLFRTTASLSSSSTSPSSPSSSSSSPYGRMTLYDRLSNTTLLTLERMLVYILEKEASAKVRKDAVETVADVANEAMARGRPWHALQAHAFQMAQAGAAGSSQPTSPSGPSVGPQPAVQRENAFRLFAGSPNLILDLQPESVMAMLMRGLEDSESIAVRHSALKACVAYLDATIEGLKGTAAIGSMHPQIAQFQQLMVPMLDTLPTLWQHGIPSTSTASSSSEGGKASGEKSLTVYLTHFLSELTPLASTHASLFAPHLKSLLGFLTPIMMPPVDCGPTPTVGKPFPSSAESNGSFTFPPPGSSGSGDADVHVESGDNASEERSTLRLTALELMVSLSEARPAMVKKVSGWAEVLVRVCLEGMAEHSEADGEGEGLAEWLKDDPSTSDDTAEMESAPTLYEQTLDRLSIALGGRAVLPPAFQYIPGLLAGYDWKGRHAGLLAIAAIAEGTGKVMVKELEKIVDMVCPLFSDVNPRVRHAACQCVGQLCTDLEESMQEKYHQRLLSVLITTLEDPEPRVHAHAAAALINFCEGVEREILIPYLDPLVDRLLRLLTGISSSPSAPAYSPPRYVQEQAITTLAMVADASETTFGNYYHRLMPLLLEVLRTATKDAADGATTGSDHVKLAAKAMECAGLVAMAVGPDVFRPDAMALVEVLLRVQQSPQLAQDPTLEHYLMSTWPKICQAIGAEFEAYLPIVMPALLQAAGGSKADLFLLPSASSSPYDEDEDIELITLDHGTYGVRTSAMDDKCRALETLVVYVNELGPRMASYLPQCLDVTLPCLRFYWHEGVREACAMLIPILLACGKSSNTLTPHMVHATLSAMINALSLEPDASFLASLFKHLTDSILVVGGPADLPPMFVDSIMEGCKRQLVSIGERRKARSRILGREMDGRASEIADEMNEDLGSSAGAGGSSIGLGLDPDAEADREEMMLMEELEDFALEDMRKCLAMFDVHHPLMFTISAVKDLGGRWESEEDED